jgi:DNA-directed RNA polymerase beta' subunit
MKQNEYKKTDTFKYNNQLKSKYLLEIALYEYLSPKRCIFEYKFNKQQFDIVVNDIIKSFNKSIVEPGEMVGMIAAQSIGEPTTQMSAPFCEHIRCEKINKNTKIISMVSGPIGELCDGLIEENPDYTFNTGHVDSVETLLDALEDEYYIIGVDGQEKTHWNKISHISRHPVNGNMMIVTTKSGRKVTTTLSHSHLVRDNQTVVPITGADLKEGMRIPVAKHIDNEFVNEYVTIDNKKYKLDYLFGWFIGAYLAEGNVTKYSTCITNVSDYFIENTKHFAARFDKTCNVNKRQGEYGPSTQTSFSCKMLAEFLLSTCGTGSFVKVIPDFAFLAPLEFKAGLIQAYMDGDGNFQCDEKHHQIRSCSRSKQLSKDMALLLNYFDIFASIKENFVKGSEIYNLSISAKYAKIYEERIGSLVHKDKLMNIVKYCERTDAHNLSDEIDKINGLGEVIAKCGKTLKLPGQSRNYGRWAKKDSIGRRTLEKYIEIFEESENAYLISDELRILKQAASSSVIWDEIVNIEIIVPEQSEYVYDFTVPANQTFMTDYGVIVHNTLNTFHFAGIASKSNVTRGVPRIEELLSLSASLKNPSLTVFLKPEDETDREKASTIQYMLEHTRLEEIVKSIEICFDPDDLNTMIDEDKTTMAQYREFETMIAECLNSSVEEDQGEKSKWIIRIIMDPEVMLEKNITMDDVNFTLNNTYKDEISCVYSDYNADKLVFRIRMKNIIDNAKSRSQKKAKLNPLDQSDQIYILKNFQDTLLNNIVLRGVKNIDKVILRKIKDNLVENAGAYVKKDIWVLDTIGTNMLDVLGLDYIDPNRTYSNDVIEIFQVLGMEAARFALYNELAEVLEFDGAYVNAHHMALLCDRMTFSHKMISIFRHGINNDDIGPIAKASFEETPEMFLKAARHAELDTMRGISANVMCGQEGFYGTAAFQVVLDINEMINLDEKYKYEYKATEDIIEESLFSGLEEKEDACSKRQLEIETNVSNIRMEEMGKDNDYDPFA